MPWGIQGPGSGSGGNKLVKDEHLGHLQIAIDAETRPETSTKFGPQDAALCRYWICADCDLVLRDYLLFGAALVPRVLEPMTEGRGIVSGRFARGEAKAGQSAAWLLSFPDDADIAQGEKWLDAHAAKMPSGRIEIETPAPVGADDSF